VSLEPYERQARTSGRDIALVDVLDRALAKGVALEGDITIAVADIELVRIGLRALIAAVETIESEQQ
jgi:hypothetical protein